MEKRKFTFSLYDIFSLKLFTRLKLQFSHLKRYKFSRGFGEIVSPILKTLFCVAHVILLKDSISSMKLTNLTFLLHN